MIRLQKGLGHLVAPAVSALQPFLNLMKMLNRLNDGCDFLEIEGGFLYQDFP